MQIKQEDYLVPEIEVTMVVVEYGFAGSLEIPEEDPEIGW
jgi:hypothetical protein